MTTSRGPASPHDSWAKRHPARAAEEARLAAERRAALADWGHKAHGTIETHAQAARVRQGALARLYLNGRISADQLAWASEIAAAHEAVTRGLGLRTMSLETRIDASRAGEAFWESLAAVRREIAYTRWRGAVSRQARAGAALAMIVNDCGLAAAARAWGMRQAGALRLLGWALDLWPGCWAEARDAVDAGQLAAAQAALLS